MKAKILSLLSLALIAGSLTAMVEIPETGEAIWCVSDKFAGTRPSLNYTGQAFVARIGTANYHCQAFKLTPTRERDIVIDMEPGDVAELKLNKRKFRELGKFQFPLVMSDFKDARSRKGRPYKQAYRKSIPEITEDGAYVKFQIDLSK